MMENGDISLYVATLPEEICMDANLGSHGMDADSSQLRLTNKFYLSNILGNSHSKS